MSDDWIKDLAKKISDALFSVEESDPELFTEWIEEEIKKFVEERIVRVYFTVKKDAKA